MWAILRLIVLPGAAPAKPSQQRKTGKSVFWERVHPKRPAPLQSVGYRSAHSYRGPDKSSAADSDKTALYRIQLGGQRVSEQLAIGS